MSLRTSIGPGERLVFRSFHDLLATYLRGDQDLQGAVKIASGDQAGSIFSLGDSKAMAAGEFPANLAVVVVFAAASGAGSAMLCLQRVPGFNSMRTGRPSRQRHDLALFTDKLTARSGIRITLMTRPAGHRGRYCK
jgi:hypothetical protein